MIIFERGDWSVTAKLDEAGDLYVISTDLDTEWHVKVLKRNLRELRGALRIERGQQPGERKTEGDILDQIERAYAVEIPNERLLVKLLRKHNIPFKEDRWGGY